MKSNRKSGFIRNSEGSISIAAAVFLYVMMIGRNAVLDDVSYTSVAIAYTTHFLGYDLTFSSIGRFPNPS